MFRTYWLMGIVGRSGEEKNNVGFFLKFFSVFSVREN